MKLLTYPAPDRLGFWLLLGEWLGITALACGVVSAGLQAGLFRAEPDLDAQSKTFADQTMRAIGPGWDAGALFARAAPELIVQPDPYIEALDRLRLEGATGAGGCFGQSSSDVLAAGDLVTAQYFCRLQVDHRPALASLSLRDDRDQWRITGFYVDGPKRPQRSGIARRHRGHVWRTRQDSNL